MNNAIKQGGLFDTDANVPNFSSIEINTETKKHNTTLTQKISWAEVKSSGLDIKQKLYVLDYLKLNQLPLSCRDLEILTGLRASSLTRVLNDLKSEKKIFVSKLDKSQYSQKLVEYYQINTSL